MLSSQITSILLLASSACAATLRPRDVVLANDVFAIDSAVKTLTDNVNAYTSGSFPTGIISGIPILLDVVNIHLINRKGYADANFSPTLNEQDSIAVVNSVTDSVAIDIPASVKALKAKKPQFVEASLVPVVVASLKLLKDDHDTFSATVEAKLTANATVTAQGEAGVAVIDVALADGIAYFS